MDQINSHQAVRLLPPPTTAPTQPKLPTETAQSCPHSLTPLAVEPSEPEKVQGRLRGAGRQAGQAQGEVGRAANGELEPQGTGSHLQRPEGDMVAEERERRREKWWQAVTGRPVVETGAGRQGRAGTPEHLGANQQGVCDMEKSKSEGRRNNRHCL